MRILILNGPNLNMTGKRKPELYGVNTLDSINSAIMEHGKAKGCECAFVQSNHEGVLIDLLQTARNDFDAALLNAGALTHYSYALRDAVECCAIPVGEVHMSDILSREPFRAQDVLKEVCVFRVMGMGQYSYIAALDRMIEFLESSDGQFR